MSGDPRSTNIRIATRAQPFSNGLLFAVEVVFFVLPRRQPSIHHQVAHLAGLGHADAHMEARN
jgi:hypothetical protein